MDKRIVFAVAGSGKTTYLVNSLRQRKRTLILTYTTSNYKSLIERIIEEYGSIPEGTYVYTYFNFIYSFCYKPVAYSRVSAQGINYKPNPGFFQESNIKHYVDSHNRLYSNRISKLLSRSEHIGLISSRISKYFDNIFIDEIQDFGGNDFNLLKKLSQIDINILFVGDYYQHTYDTSRDGNINTSLHKSFNSYIKNFVDMGLIPDANLLKKSYRCSPTTCKYISDNLGISIESHREDTTSVTFIEEASTAKVTFENDSIVKLFYNMNYLFPCHSRNWGDCKGEDRYQDVCVVLNKTTLEHYQEGKLSQLSPATLNKLYVAISRARGNVFLVPHTFTDVYKKIIPKKEKVKLLL